MNALFTPSVVARFSKKVTIGLPDDCWLWTAAKTARGYGVLRVDGTNRYAHRIAFALSFPGVSIDGLEVMHRCDNPPCCNPSHLSVGTHRDNMRDMARKGRFGCTPIERVARGSDHGMAKLSEADIPVIRALYLGGTTASVIASRFGVGHVCAWNAATGRTWKHVK